MCVQSHILNSLAKCGTFWKSSLKRSSGFESVITDIFERSFRNGCHVFNWISKYIFGSPIIDSSYIIIRTSREVLPELICCGSFWKLLIMTMECFDYVMYHSMQCSIIYYYLSMLYYFIIENNKCVVTPQNRKKGGIDYTIRSHVSYKSQFWKKM